MAIQIISESYWWLPNASTFFLTFAFVILFSIGAAFIRRYRFVQKCEKVPGPPAQLPLFGSLTALMIEPEDMVVHFMKLYEKWNVKGLCRIWVGPIPAFLLGGAEAAEVVLSSSRIIDKSREYRFLHPWLSTGLLTSAGKKWQQRRKMLTPAFHFKILEDFLSVFNEQSATLVNKLSQKIDETGNEFDIFPFITMCTLDIICETAMGRHVNAQSTSDSDYVTAVYELGRIIQARQTRPWLQLDLLFQFFPRGYDQKRCLSILHDFTDQVIRERKAERQSKNALKDLATSHDDDNFISKKPRLAFLDLLLEASQDGKVLSDLDIREEVDTFMFEGHDTTAAAISWSLLHIGNHPAVLEHVNDELDRVFGDSNRPITMADLSELKYLECCIKEALRLCPSVPLFSRHLKEDVQINGYDIPAGVSLAVATFFIHRDPKYYPDPQSYQPERFFPENSLGRHPYAYIPFSAGPRNCIGQRFALMEEKVILASILRRFHIKALDKFEDVPMMAELILRPRDGIRLCVTPK